MAAGVFTVTEFRRSGATTSEAPDGEKFVWTADMSPPNSSGGARAAPVKGWVFGTEVEVNKTRYPGAKEPTIQVLTVDYSPQTFKGTWLDKWNFDGYAQGEYRRFEAMVRRGNPVRVQYQSEVIEGIITKFEPDRRWQGEIGYSFTLEPLGRPDSDDTPTRSPGTVQSAETAYYDTQFLAESIYEVQGDVPASAMATDRANAVETLLKTMNDRVESLAGVLDTRTGALKPISEFLRTATAFRLVAASCTDVLDKMVDARADTELAYKTAIDTLNFEVWSRSIRYQCRVLRGQSNQAAKDMDARANPPAQKTYRPYAGESLYNVSRRYFGHPYMARAIADRNNIRYIKLTGKETLIIPEQGPA